MAKVNAYLLSNGNCETVFNFHKSVFGGEFVNFSKFKDMPPMEGMELPESAREKVMHVSLPISKETVLMGSDGNPAFGDVVIGQNVSLSVARDSKQEAEHIFKYHSEGGKINMPIADTFWGSYFVMPTNKFGQEWMVNFDYPKKCSSQFLGVIPML